MPSLPTRQRTPGQPGAIVPDLPLEEQGAIADALGQRGLALIPLVAPNHPAGAPRRDLLAR